MSVDETWNLFRKWYFLWSDFTTLWWCFTNKNWWECCTILAVKFTAHSYFRIVVFIQLAYFFLIMCHTLHIKLLFFPKGVASNHCLLVIVVNAFIRNWHTECPNLHCTSKFLSQRNSKHLKRTPRINLLTSFAKCIQINSMKEKQWKPSKEHW